MSAEETHLRQDFEAHLRANPDLLGDQRAKDLIDQNEGETDPQRAIRCLHRALEYGRTSIQATQAFQRLGRHYEALGNVRLAIKYYTEAIVLQDQLDIEPVPVLYWRGALYHQSGDTGAARDDFKRAIDLEGGQTYFPEARGFAERVLAAWRDEQIRAALKV